MEQIVPIFRERYPSIKLDLVSDGKLSDITQDGFDAGIRLGESLLKDMIAIPLGPEVRFVVVASPQYLNQYTAPITPIELNHHHCIRQRLPSGKRYHWAFFKDGQPISVDVPGVISLDNNNLMVSAATQGMGIAFVPENDAKE